MNTLAMIRERKEKLSRLSEAQRLMAKAYRGVEYIDAHHTAVCKPKKTDLVYRGLRYSV